MAPTESVFLPPFNPQDSILKPPQEPSKEKMENHDAPAIAQKIGNFFTQSVYDVIPTMILSESTIPDISLHEWRQISNELKSIDPKNLVLPLIAKTMQEKMIALISHPPLTSSSEIIEILSDTDAVERQISSKESVTPEMCRLLGNGMALVAAGRLPEEAFSNLIDTNPEITSEDRFQSIITSIENDNYLDAHEVMFALVVNKKMPELCKWISDNATSPNEGEPYSIYFLASNHLKSLREYYPIESPDPKKWHQYFQHINQRIYTERRTRKNIGESYRYDHFLPGDVTLPNGEKVKLDMDNAYAFLTAIYLYGQEKGLFK